MKPIIKYIILTGLRDKLFLGIFIALIATFSLAIFLGSTVLVEAQQTTAAYIAGSSRAVIILGMILFTCLNINRAFSNKEVEFILAKSISREQFILAYLTGFLLTTAMILLPLTLAILAIVKVNKIGILCWTFSLFIELWIVISFAILTSLILRSSFSSILATLAFYLISRLMGVFVLAVNLPQDFIEVKNHLLPSILKIISLAFPRLDLFTQSEWLAYGVVDFSRLQLVALQAAIYIALMLFMAFFDFRRKQF